MGSYTRDNDTFACSDRECQISCQSPQFGPNLCYSMQQNFLDGTLCTGGGKCSNGMCKGGSFGKEVQSWIENNKTLVIALSSVLGGIVVLSILCCCWSRYRRRNRRNKRGSAPQPPLLQQQQQQPMMQGGRNPGPWVPQMAYGAGGQQYQSQSRSQGGGRSGRRESRSGRAAGVAPIRQATGGWGNDGRWDPTMNVDGQHHVPPPVWQPSVRYA